MSISVMGSVSAIGGLSIQWGRARFGPPLDSGSGMWPWSSLLQHAMDASHIGMHDGALSELL